MMLDSVWKRRNTFLQPCPALRYHTSPKPLCSFPQPQAVSKSLGFNNVPCWIKGVKHLSSLAASSITEKAHIRCMSTHRAWAHIYAHSYKDPSNSIEKTLLYLFHKCHRKSTSFIQIIKLGEIFLFNLFISLNNEN